MRYGRMLTVGAIWGAFGLAAWLGTRAWRLASHLPIDANLGQWTLPEPANLEAFVRWSAVKYASEVVYLSAAGVPVAITQSDLGFELDVDATLEQARRLAPGHSVWERIRRVISGPPEKPRVVEPILAFDEQTARLTLERIAPLVNRAPIDARLDFSNHRKVEDEPGRELDIATTLAQLRGAAPSENDVVELQFRSIPSRISSQELPAVDVSHVLSQYETSFAHRAGARAVNIRRGALILDGVQLAPHSTFSFNRVVGPRSESRGFVDAPVIVNDEIDKGVGGGICQVASTLYAAAIFAGFPIVERRSHSRPSGYAPLGLDATVIDGKVDLRFSNPYDEPLIIHAFLPHRTTLRIEILGREPAWKVEHQAQVVKRYPFLRRIVEKSEIAPGEFKRSQKGTYGYDIISIVRYTDATGAVATHQYKSTYYPVPEVFWVNSSAPLATLPPLPEGADGIEDRD